MHPTPSRKILAALCLLVLAACSQSPELNNEALAQAGISNLLEPEANMMSSGQPTEEQFHILAESGVKHVINLRTPGEQDWDEGALVSSLNMQYHSIPVSVAEGVTRENAQALHDLLEQVGDGPVLIHCASGQRVGALMALSAQQNEGMDADSAMEEGRRWGLSSPRLTPVVSSLLSENL